MTGSPDGKCIGSPKHPRFSLDQSECPFHFRHLRLCELFVIGEGRPARQDKGTRRQRGSGCVPWARDWPWEKLTAAFKKREARRVDGDDRTGNE